MWQQPWQDHLQDSWMCSRQTPKRIVCRTYIRVINVLTVEQEQGIKRSSKQLQKTKKRVICVCVFFFKLRGRPLPEPSKWLKAAVWTFTFYWTHPEASESKTSKCPETPLLLLSERSVPKKTKKQKPGPLVSVNLHVPFIFPLAGQLWGEAEIPRVVVCQRGERHRRHHRLGYKWKYRGRHMESDGVWLSQ